MLESMDSYRKSSTMWTLERHCWWGLWFTFSFHVTCQNFFNNTSAVVGCVKARWFLNCCKLGINVRKPKSPLDLILKMMILLHHFLLVVLADPAAPWKGKPAEWAGRTFQPAGGENIRSCRSSPAPLLYRCIWKHKTTTYTLSAT